jgi:riboflavin kinase/FMN adenylyltransferase
MQIFKGIEAFEKTPHRPVVLTLGNFDGVHLGHQKILRHVAAEAQKAGALSAVMTFQEHPQRILRPGAPPPDFIFSPDHKLFQLEQLGMDVCFFMPFTPAFAKTEADSFVRETLLKHVGMKKMVLGYNARFGHERKGSPELMRQLSKQLSFEFEEIGPVEVGGEAVSSSRIRKLLAAGNLNEAAACLGRPFSTMGKVVAGDSRGKELGFPTANVELGVELLIPFGVYPVRVREAGLKPETQVLEGVLNYGIRPTFGKPPKPVLEVFFYPRLRPEQTFEGKEALKRQIGLDVEAAKGYFASPMAPGAAQISAFTKTGK